MDLVRSEGLDRIAFVFIGFFLGDNQLHVSQSGDRNLLRPDVVGFVIDIALDRFDEVCQRIDTDLSTTVGHLSVAPKRADPVLAVGVDLFGKTRIVGEPRVKEVSVRRDTYLVFEFGDDLAGKIVLGIVVLVITNQNDRSIAALSVSGPKSRTKERNFLTRSRIRFFGVQTSLN